MKKYTFSSIAVAAILGMTMFTGCGSSNDNDDTPATSTVSGQALAAYISGGNAFIDCNKNGVQDSGELNATTTADGNYSITGQVCSDYDIVVINGRNSETGVAIKYPTVAPKGYTKVSPVTTMLAKLSTTDRTTFLEDLNITEAELNTDYNKAPSGSITQAQIAKVAAIKSYVETALTTSTTAAQVTTVATALKAAVATAKASASSVDFTNSTVLASLNTNLVTNLSTAGVSTTDLNTTLTNQVTNIITIASATTSTALTEALNVVENANAATTVATDSNVAKVGLTTVTLNDKNISIVNNASFDTNITAGTSIEGFFPVSISGLSVSKTFTEQTVNFTAEIKNTAGDMVSLSINGAKLTGNEHNTSTVVVPVDTEAVLTSSASLSNLVTAMGSTRLTTTTATEKTYTNSAKLEFEDIINRITSDKRAAILEALTNYFSKAGTYTVTIKVTGQDTSVFIPTVVGKINVQQAK